MFRYSLLLVLAACASSAPPAVGPEGAVGPQGPAGEQGPVGPQGAPGPKGDVGPQGPAGLSAVKAQPLDAGSICPTGGLLLTDADGGTTALCNGTKGDTGATGAQGAPGLNGAQGPVGATGASPKTLTVRDVDGGIVGSVYPISSNGVDFVYLEGPECVGYMDWQNNVISSLQTTVYYTGPSCTGTAVIHANTANIFPIACLKVGTQGFKVRQPVLIQMVTTLSMYSKGPNQPDGGVTTGCYPTPPDTYGSAAVDTANLPDVAGPFYFGNR